MSNVEGVENTPEAVESVREELIVLRDEALAQGEMTWGLVLSHAIVYLAGYKEGLSDNRSL